MTIVIPSQNIYSTSVDFSRRSKITKSTITPVYINKKNGNILQREYTANFFSISEKNNNGSIEWVPVQTPSSNVSIEGKTATVYISVPIPFFVNYILDSNGNITSHKLKIQRQKYSISTDTIYFDDIQVDKIAPVSSAVLKSPNGNLAFAYEVKTSTVGEIGSGDEYYVLSDIISVVGDYIEIDQDKSGSAIEKGSGKDVFKNSTNDIVQDQNETGMITFPYMNDYILSNQVEKYQNGKKIVTILCNVSDYYTVEGLHIITPNSSNKMTFAIGDIVIPYVYTALGVDEPLARKADGTPMEFRVCGVRMVFDGAVWQELTLKEV